MTIQYHRMEDTSIHQQEVHGPELPHHCTGSYGSPCAWMVCSTQNTNTVVHHAMACGDQEQDDTHRTSEHHGSMDPRASVVRSGYP